MTWLCAVLAALLFCFAPGRKDITTSHEARVAQVARQMAAVGWPWNVQRVTVPATTLSQTAGKLQLLPDASQPPLVINPWLVPVMNGAVRLQKPPLPYWCAATLYRIAGVEWSAGIARLVPAIGGAVCTLILIDLAGLLLGRRAGPVAGLVWLSCYFCFDEFRKAMADPYLAVFSLISAWAWIRAASPGAQRKTAWLLLGYVSFALASLAKFPVNLLHVGLLLIAYHFCTRRRLPGPPRAHVAGVLLYLLIFLPWPIYILTSVPHALRLWKYESVGEFGENAAKARGPFFYFINLAQLAVPWTATFVVGAYSAVRQRARRRRAALVWLALELVVFSFSFVKKNAYLLPAMPAITLLIVQGLQLVLASRRVRRLRSTRDWLVGIQVAFGVTLALLTAALAWQAWQSESAGHATIAAVIVAAIGLPLALLPLHTARSQDLHRWLVAQTCAYVVLIAGMYHAGIYPGENDRSARAACAVILDKERTGEATLDTLKLAEEATVYLPLNDAGNPSAPMTLALADDRRGAVPPAAAFSIDVPAAAIRPVDLTGLKGGKRWKLYETPTTQPMTMRTIQP